MGMGGNVFRDIQGMQAVNADEQDVSKPVGVAPVSFTGSEAKTARDK